MFKTREEWLAKAVERLSHRFEKFGKIPEKLQVITSFATRKTKHNLGMCYPVTWSKDQKTPYITITPLYGKGDEAEILETLMHEMVHSINHQQGDNGHGKSFAKIALKIGLVKPMKTADANPELKKELQALAKDLGPYPHMQMVHHGKEKKKSAAAKNGGLICFNSEETPEYKIYVCRSWIEKYGAPLCPTSKQPMVEVEK